MGLINDVVKRILSGSTSYLVEHNRLSGVSEDILSSNQEV